MTAFPRNLHPGAWWLWALGLLTAASRSTNLAVLALILAVAWLVVKRRRSDAPWARAFRLFLRLGIIVLFIRFLAQVLFGTPIGTPVLFTLPELSLPSFAAGITVGGPVTGPSVVAAFSDGARLAVMLALIGAANTLANPKRLLASLPAALYEVGVAVVVALSFAPSLIASVTRVREARRLRGREDRGIRGMLSVAAPVLEDALERSLGLAAAMDSRGYGRRASVNPRVHTLTTGLFIVGLVGMALGLFGLLDSSTPSLLTLLAFVCGVGAAVGGLTLAGRRGVRTRYRPDRFALPEQLTMLAGLVAAGVTIWASVVQPGVINPPIGVLVWPVVPWPVLAGLMLAAGPAFFAPPAVLTQQADDVLAVVR
jgi:energy-coupling factor transport system permease protein